MRRLLTLHLAAFAAGLLCHRLLSEGVLWDLCDLTHRLLEALKDG